MPHFTAPISTGKHLFIDAYTIAVVAPQVEPYVKPLPINALIVPEVEGCFISEDLARQYDPTIDEGDLMYLMLFEEKENGAVHQHPLAIPVRFSPREDYIQLGLDHILMVFDVFEYDPQPHESPDARRLELRLRKCIEYFDDPPETVG